MLLLWIPFCLIYINKMLNNNNNNHHRPQQHHRNATNMGGIENVNSHCTCRVDKKTQTYPLKKHSWSHRLLSTLRRRSRPNISFSNNSSPRQAGEDERCPVMEKVPKSVILIIIPIKGSLLCHNIRMYVWGNFKCGFLS